MLPPERAEHAPRKRQTSSGIQDGWVPDQQIAQRLQEELRLTPEELAAQEQYELMQEQARRRNNRKKYLPEEKIEIDPLYTRVSSPEERERTGRWLNYYNNPGFTGNPIRI